MNVRFLTFSLYAFITAPAALPALAQNEVRERFRSEVLQAVRDGSVEDLSAVLDQALTSSSYRPGALEIQAAMRAGVRGLPVPRGVAPKREDRFGVSTRLKMIELLALAGADVNERLAPPGTAPAYDVVDQADAAILEFLLDRGAKTQATDFGRRYSPVRSVLRTVLSWEDPQVVSRLLPKILKAGADVNESLGRGRTIVHALASEGRVDRVRWLLDQGANMSARDPEQRTSLMMAASGGHYDVVKLLLERRAAATDRDAGGASVLHYGIRFPRIVAVLLEAGGDPNAADLVGRTVLHWAAATWPQAPWTPELTDENRMQIEAKARADLRAAATLLIKAGAKVDARDLNGSAPLHLAATREMVGLLLDAGAAIESRNAYGFTPLLSSTGQRSDVGIALMQRGANVKAVTAESEAFVHLAAQSYRGSPLLNEAISKGADVQSKDGKGRTPLHYAFMHGCRPEVVRTLLDRGADPYVEDRGGDSPLLAWARAVEHDHKGLCLAQLIEKKVAVARPNRNGASAIQIIKRARWVDAAITSQLGLPEQKGTPDPRAPASATIRR